ncbi:MAG: UDP-2,3-diacylglucosamine diphosphatase [Bdellovibrionales bacterium]
MPFDRHVFKELLGRGTSIISDNPDAPELLHDAVECEAVYVSDQHFISPFCNSRSFSSFLSHIKPKNIFLGGDLFNSWRGNYDIYKLHQKDPFQADVCLKLSEFARHGVNVVLTPGNHDERIDAKRHALLLGGITITPEASYTTPEGQRILVLHGHQFDSIPFGHLIISPFGALACEAIGSVSTHIRKWGADKKIQRVLASVGFRKRWSLTTALQKAYQCTSYKDHFERASLKCLFAANARIAAKNELGTEQPEAYYTKIVCGHTHLACMREVSSPRDKNGKPLGPEKVTYANTGCWSGLFKNNEGAGRVFAPYFPNNTAFIAFSDGRFDPVQWIPSIGLIRPRLRSNGLFKGAFSKKAARAMMLQS